MIKEKLDTAVPTTFSKTKFIYNESEHADEREY